MTEDGQGFWAGRHAGTVAMILSNPAAETPEEKLLPGEERDAAAATAGVMLSMGLLESSSCSAHWSQLCREFGVSAQHIMRKKWAEGAIIMAANTKIAEVMEDALRANSIPPAGKEALRIVAVEDYLDPRVARMSIAELSGRPWMAAKLTGEEIWIGPTVIPGQKPCWECLTSRLREHRWLEWQLARGVGGGLRNCYTAESRIRFAAELAAHEAARWMLEAAGSLEGVIWSFSWVTMSAQRHRIAAQPNCNVCGGPGELAGRLVTRHARSYPGPYLRELTTEELLGKLEPLTSPVTGILRRFERADLSVPGGMHAYGGVYCPTLPPEPARPKDMIFEPGVAAGVGWSLDEAKAGCLAEAAERYSIRFHGREECIADSFRALAGAAVHPNDVSLFSPRQYACRSEWNQIHRDEEHVPEPFDEDQSVEWMRARSLTGQRERFVPLAMVKLFYRPQNARWIGDADSSGCASGASMDEATLHAIFELVERDSLGIWWFNRPALPELRPEQIGDARTRHVCEALAERGWRVWFHDITTDLAIPSAVAIAQTEAGEWVLGSAAHLYGDMALRRAILEVWQLSQSRRRPSPAPERTTGDLRQMTPGSSLERVKSIQDALSYCVDLIASAGHEVISVDLTRQDIGLPVVRAIVPGLRHKKPRFADGRLYHVPVRMHWRSTPADESGMFSEGV
jgi:ribosomal protein S12 methylthiotransferase accessory factor